MSQDEKLIRPVLETGAWRFGNYVFASGKTANNKLEMERVLDDERAAKLLMGAMSRIIKPYKPRAIWGVPEGGQQFAERLSENLDLPLVRLRKLGEGSQSTFDYDSDESLELADSAVRLVGVEDIINELTSTRKALSLPSLSEKTSAVVAGWIRGIFVPRQGEHFDVRGAIVKPLPNEITVDHPFYRRYGHLAVQEDEAS